MKDGKVGINNLDKEVIITGSGNTTEEKLITSENTPPVGTDDPTLVVEKPIPVVLVNDESTKEKTNVIDQVFTTAKENMENLDQRIKESLQLIPKPPGKLLRFWLWFQKHGFTTVCIIAVGIVIGIQVEKWGNHREMVKAINLQKFEFEHSGHKDRFIITPSTDPVFYPDEDDTKKQQPQPVQQSQPEAKTKGK